MFTIILNFLLTLYFFILITFLVICSPIYLYRFLVSKSRRFLRPDLSHLVCSRSVVLGIDGFPSHPKWNLVVWLTMEGVLDLTGFQSYFEDKFVRVKERSGEYRYPEYQQFITKWMSFYFWKWDIQFDIRNHIGQYSGQYSSEPWINDSTLIQIIKELTSAPWNPNRSPWEFIQISNYLGCGDSNPGVKSILIFRLHHVLGDGYFILKLLMQDICGINLKMAAQPQQRSENSSCFLQILSAPSDFMRMCFKGMGRDDNPWHIPENKISRNPCAALSQPISLNFIKQIRKSHGVSFTAVLNAAVAGGMRKMMMELGIEPPATIHQAIPVPMAGHPQKLRNHFIFSFISLPTGVQDPLKRLILIEQNLQDLKSSFGPLLTFWTVPLIGSLFPSMMRPFTINNLTTCLMSNFPGTPHVPFFRQVKVVDMMFGAGLGPGSTGIGFTLISYVGFIRLLTVVDPGILNSDDAVQMLNQNILEELEILAAAAGTSAQNQEAKPKQN